MSRSAMVGVEEVYEKGTAATSGDARSWIEALPTNLSTKSRSERKIKIANGIKIPSRSKTGGVVVSCSYSSSCSSSHS
jgi:hypothetical protein